MVVFRSSFLLTMIFVNLGRLPLVRSGRPDQSICKENSTFNQNCPARSFYFYIVCIAVMSFECGNHKRAVHTFTMFTEFIHRERTHNSQFAKVAQHRNPTPQKNPKKAMVVCLILNYYNNQSSIAIAMCSFRHTPPCGFYKKAYVNGNFVARIS